jgi:phage baseplate assembly protein W
MSGFGTMAFGAGAFGLGTPATGEPPPDGPAGTRYIDPVQRDYAQDTDTKQLKQMPKTRQRVLLALMTLLGSSSVLPKFGVRFPKKMGDTFDAQCKNAVRSAMRHLTDVEQVVRIDGITVERGAGGRARITVSYSDLLEASQDAVTVG